MTTNKNSTRYYSGRQERKVAKILNGKTVSNSGAADFVGGDVQNEHFLIECKTVIGTRHKSFSIKEEWLDKVAEEAIGMRKQGWALCFEYNQADNRRFYVINERMFQLLNYFLDEERRKEDDGK